MALSTKHPNTKLIKTMHSKRRWLPLAVVPLFSMAVLAGCSSDDDNNPDTTTPEPSVVVGDGNGNGIADGFETVSADDDANGNSIADIYEAPADTTTAAADTNDNGIDDSFEASLTGGTDANADGIDDAAAAVVAASDESCALDDAEDCALLTQIADQEAVWNAASLDSYVYQYTGTPATDGDPGCPAFDILPPALITVENGSIVKVTLDGVEESSAFGFRTIDQHFDNMRDNVDRLQPTPSYSQALGYPTSYRTANPIEDCPSLSSVNSINICGDDIDCELTSQ